MARDSANIREDIRELKNVLQKIQDLQLIHDALDGIDVHGRPLGSQTMYRLDVQNGAWKEPQAEDIAEIRDRLVQFSPSGALDRFFPQTREANILGEAISHILLETPIDPKILRGVPPENSLPFIRFLRDAKYRLLGPSKARKEIAEIRKKFGNVEERLGELERELEQARFGHSKEREMISALKAGKAPSNPKNELQHNPFADLAKMFKK